MAFMVLLGFDRFYRVSIGSTGYYSVFTVCYPSFTEFYRVLPDRTGFDNNDSNSNRNNEKRIESESIKVAGKKKI